jgi:hypothetical protein
MKMFVGNCAGVIDFGAMLAEIKQHVVEPYTGNMELDPTNKYYQDALMHKRLAEEAGYTKNDAIEFRHYYPGQHFDMKYVNQLAEFVQVTPLMSFVSEIRPGKCAPWHWDINPWEEEQEKLGTLHRYLCFITDPKPGHVFMVETEAFYWENRGNVYKYPHMHSWHAGANAGLEPKFLMTMTGYTTR